MITCENCPVNQRCCSNVHTRTDQADLDKVIKIGNKPHHHLELERLRSDKAIMQFIEILKNLPQLGAHYYHIGDGTIRLAIVGPCNAFNPTTRKCSVHETDLLPGFCQATQVGSDICRP